MKKRLLALTLVSALTLSSTAVAFANTPEDESGAAIAFNMLDDGVWDPDGPTVPEIPDIEGFVDLHSLSLWFGEWDVEYLMSRETNLQEGVHWMEFESIEGRGLSATADIYIIATGMGEWEVTAAITRFEAENGAHVLEDFRLNLSAPPHHAFYHPLFSANINARSEANPATLREGGSRDDNAFGISDRVAWGSPGVFGVMYDGLLGVPRGASLADGDVQADMLWRLVPDAGGVQAVGIID